MLEVDLVEACYGKQRVLHGVSLHVGKGEVVALIGPNAAGKSTTLRVLAGLKRADGGSIRLGNVALTASDTVGRVKRGLVLVPEGRQVFIRFTVYENLLMGAYHRMDRDHIQHEIEHVFDMFPRLGERRNQKAGSMSGGEQQMLAIGRGLMAKPSVMLLDEPTLGLAPIVIDELGRIVRRLAQDGMMVLLAEQNAAMALGCADRAYLLESGKIVLDGNAAALQENPKIRKMYLGH